jgi:hypothetical protein
MDRPTALPRRYVVIRWGFLFDSKLLRLFDRRDVVPPDELLCLLEWLRV